ncbi:MAG: molybdenum cofactor biosynthesis protein MoaE [Bacteroidetes bacterium]|nr:molybdenum cofactor biosynthesis protein MoaE [Bacteroidota bacterium]
MTTPVDAPVFCGVSEKVIEISDAYQFIKSDLAGGIDFFVGTIRNHNEGKSVIRLEYHIYDDMVEKEFHKIVAEARLKWKLEKIYVNHRKGELQIGDVAVIVAVSTVHRSEAFEACRYIIDELKHRAPIWKKEFTTEGIFWVEGCEHKHAGRN